MRDRLYLAALDHNMNASRQQAITTAGNLRYKLQYSKAARNYMIIKEKENKNYSFRTEILYSIIHSCSLG